jgi:glycerol-3-phosphate acyltransferase PlsY
MTTVAVIVLLSYLVGGIPWSLLVVRWLKGIDLRTTGSGNLGATNVYRAIGAPGAIAVLVLDILKGLVAVIGIARLRVDPPALGADGLALAAGVAAIAGHMFSPYLGFRGGKGIATTAGVFLGLEPRACGIAFAAFGVGLAASRGIVSVASLLAALVLPVAVWAVGAARGAVAPLHLGAAAALALVIWIKHAANLGRLLRGEEKRLFERRAGGKAT